MTRKTPEWIGNTPETSAPRRAKIRILERQDEKCTSCGIQLGEIMKPEFDHIIALVNGGENRESNLQALCKPCHKNKTKLDVAEKAKIAKRKQKRFGLSGPRQKIQSRGFAPAPPQNSATRPMLKPLPPRRP